MIEAGKIPLVFGNGVLIIGAVAIVGKVAELLIERIEKRERDELNGRGR